jgi:predicted membrane-bound dolichyl-phosphate-mannose-protein mannosyltransferase
MPSVQSDRAASAEPAIVEESATFWQIREARKDVRGFFTAGSGSVARNCVFVFLSGLALLTVRLGKPSDVVFDERLYIKGAKAIFAQEQDTNPEHPPAGKYLIGMGIAALGDNAWGWRIASVVAGAVTLAVIFAWVCEIADPFTAWIAVALVVCNGFWFVMSRVAMISIFELAFAVLGMYFLARERYWYAGVSLGYAAACRWNGVFAIGLAVVYLVCLKKVRKAGLVGVSAVVSYVWSWFPYLGLHPIKFYQAQLFIFHFHRTATGNAVLATPWYSWPLRSDPQPSLDYLSGNPVIVFAALFLAAAAIAFRFRARLDARQWLVVAGSIVFWLQWAVTGRQFMFYYYFLDAMMFLSIAVALALGSRRLPGTQTRAAIPVVCVAALWFAVHYTSFTAISEVWDAVIVCALTVSVMFWLPPAVKLIKS